MIINRRLVRFRIAFVVLGLLLYLYGFRLDSAKAFTGYLDFIFWLSTLLILCGALMDLRLHRGYDIASTLMLEVFGLILALFGRLAITIYLEYLHRLFAPPTCLPYYVSCYLSVMKLSTFIFSGGLLVLVSQAISYVKGPIEIGKSVSYKYLWETLRATFVAGLRAFISKHYLAVAFAIAFILRLLPELYSWPLPIGWDTLAYIAYLKDYAMTLNPFRAYIWMGSPRNIPPLMAILLTPLVRVVDPMYLMKLWEPLMLGFVATLSAAYTRHALKASKEIAFLAGIATSINIVVIGSTVQWSRHMLGLVMLLAFLLLSAKNSPIGSFLALIAMSMAYEPTAALAAILSIYETYKYTRMRARKAAYFMLAALLVSAFLLLWYTGFHPVHPSATTGITLAGTGSFSWVSSVNFVIGWTLMFLMALLPAAKPLKEHANPEYNITVTLLLLAFISPFLCPILAVQFPHRAVPILFTLLMPAAVVGLLKYSRLSLSLFLLVTVGLGSVYTLSPEGASYLDTVKAVNSKAFPCCGLSGFPWSLRPSVSLQYLECVRNISEVLARNETVIVDSLMLNNALHIFIRDPKNIHPAGFKVDPNQLSNIIADMFNGDPKLKGVYVVTSFNYTEINISLTAVLRNLTLNGIVSVKNVTKYCWFNVFYITKSVRANASNRGATDSTHPLRKRA